MRTHSKTMWVVGVAALLAIAGAAHADVTFDFDDLNFLDDENAISTYMSQVFDGTNSSVTVSGALATSTGITIGNIVGKSFTITFNESLTGTSFDGWILWPESGAKFRYWAIGEDGTTIVDSLELSSPGPDHFFNLAWRSFSAPVRTLKFSDSGVLDIGIDNLVVATASSPHGSRSVPAPGGALLLLAGLATAGWLKRRIA